MTDYFVRQNIIREAEAYAREVAAAGEQLGYWKQDATDSLSGNPSRGLKAQTSEGINLWFKPNEVRGEANVRCSLGRLTALVVCQGAQDEAIARVPDNSPTASVGIKRAPAVAARAFYLKVVLVAVASGVHASMTAELEGEIERYKAKDAALSALSAMGYKNELWAAGAVLYALRDKPEGWPDRVDLLYDPTHGYRVGFLTEVPVSNFAQRLAALERPPEASALSSCETPAPPSAAVSTPLAAWPAWPR